MLFSLWQYILSKSVQKEAATIVSIWNPSLKWEMVWTSWLSEERMKEKCDGLFSDIDRASHMKKSAVLSLFVLKIAGSFPGLNI